MINLNYSLIRIFTSICSNLEIITFVKPEYKIVYEENIFIMKFRPLISLTMLVRTHSVKKPLDFGNWKMALDLSWTHDCENLQK